MDVSARTPDEEARLHALSDLDLPCDLAPDRFHRITRLACRVLDAPITLVQLVPAAGPWFESVQGLGLSEAPHGVSFCSQAILGHDTLLVPDTQLDPRFVDDPRVIGRPFIRFYAGHPVTALDGSRLGALCVIDRKPRELSAADRELLRDLADCVSNELRVAALSQSRQELVAERNAQLHRSIVDSLTQLCNRQAILDVLHRELCRARCQHAPMGVLMVDVDHFKRINDTHGHVAGDRALRSVAKLLRSGVRLYDTVGRYGGEEFLIVLIDCDRATATAVGERVRARVEASVIELETGPLHATVSVGVTVWDGGEIEAARLLALADRALYRAKALGRNRVEV
jgi:diguanylate cyclase (GGDEF)-like protein